MTDETLEGKNLIELLDLLVPVPEPAAISMWPETEGWIWLGLVCLAGVICGFWAWRKKRVANAYRRAALAELNTAGDDPIAIATILRRTALVAYPRGNVAGLAGEDWLRFLDETASGQGFSTDTGRAMAAAPYRREKTPVQGLGALARSWVRHHKAEATS